MNAMSKSIIPLLALYLSAAALISSCSKENAYQDDANQQNNLVSQQKTQDLNQVQGTYTGKMQLLQSGLDLDVVIVLFVNQTNASQPDQINKVQVPTLGGNLTFPALKSISAASNFGDLISAMGQTLSISFSNGDFNTNSLMITLPYSSGGSTYSNDQVIGIFQNGVFSGEWDSHSYGKMGTFTLERSDT
jgi:hypothetical protein